MTQTVTPRNSEVCTSDFNADPSEREIGSESPETLHSAMTDSDDRPTTTGKWLAKFKDNFTPPELFTDRRPAFATMRLYAQRGRFTADLHGAVRALGIAWFRGVAVPGLVAGRSWEWLTERPARFLVVGVVVKLLSFLPPVAWTVDHLIHPGVDTALRIFL